MNTHMHTHGHIQNTRTHTINNRQTNTYMKISKAGVFLAMPN